MGEESEEETCSQTEKGGSRKWERGMKERKEAGTCSEGENRGSKCRIRGSRRKE